MHRLRPALLVPILLLAGTGAIDRRDPEYCFPQAQAALAGVYLDTPLDSVLLRLGRPTRRRARRAGDAADGLPTLELTYPRLQIDVGRGKRVERLSTTSPGVRMPNGIRVGMTLAEVARRLAVPDSLEDLLKTTWNPPLCEAGPMDVAVYTPEVAFTWTPGRNPFDSKRPSNVDRRLSRIELASYGP